MESERFFSLATSLYQNKQRNNLSGESAAKLLFIKVIEKKTNGKNEEMVYEENETESEEEDGVEPFEESEIFGL